MQEIYVRGCPGVAMYVLAYNENITYLCRQLRNVLKL